jgi:lipid-A-disaccharide synthase-like uncharacterized protein
MTLLDMLGYGGFLLLAICWIPQTIATIKTGRVEVEKSFLFFYALGASLLMLQAIGLGNKPLILLNAYTAAQSAFNLYYGLFPRKKRHETAAHSDAQQAQNRRDRTPAFKRVVRD